MQIFAELVNDAVTSNLNSALLRQQAGRFVGNEPEERVIEPHFKAYMFHRAVPPWVRHFTRHVIDLAAGETLDPRDFGIVTRRANRRDVARGKLYLVYLTIGVVALVLLADLTADRLGLSGCLFPPCY